MPERRVLVGDPGDPTAPPGTRPWAIAARSEIAITLKERDDAENHLKVTRDGFIRHEGWKALTDRYGQPFETWEAFCKARRPYGLGIDPEHLDAEVERRAEYAKHGGDRKSEEVKNQERNAHLKGDGSVERTLARLERDSTQHPDPAKQGSATELCSKVKAGELSAHAAAKAMGYRKEKTILQQLESLWRKATPAERAAFLDTHRTEGV